MIASRRRRRACVARGMSNPKRLCSRSEICECKSGPNVTKAAKEQMDSGTAREMAYVFAMDFLPAFHRMTVVLAPCGALAVRGPVMMLR